MRTQLCSHRASDAGHDRQRDIVAEITGRNVTEFKTGVKDLAALNKTEVSMIETAAEAERDRQSRTPPIMTIITEWRDEIEIAGQNKSDRLF
jgi:hypothetical protein